MKKDIHPEYHEITLVMTDGTKRTTKSTWGKPGEEMRLSIDPLNHPAWIGQQRVLGTEGQVARFNKRFGNLGQLNRPKQNRYSQQGRVSPAFLFNWLTVK